MIVCHCRFGSATGKPPRSTGGDQARPANKDYGQTATSGAESLLRAMLTGGAVESYVAVRFNPIRRCRGIFAALYWTA